jgi:hypothetical protein
MKIRIVRLSLAVGVGIIAASCSDSPRITQANIVQPDAQHTCHCPPVPSYGYQVCRPYTELDIWDVDKGGWLAFGFPKERDTDTVGHAHPGEQFELSLAGEGASTDDSKTATALINHVEWQSTNPAVATVVATGPNTAVLTAAATGTALRDYSSSHFGPVFASAYFNDGSCITVNLAACPPTDALRFSSQCVDMKTLVVE